MQLDIRHKHIISKIEEAFSGVSKAEAEVFVEQHIDVVKQFLKGDLQRLLVFHQIEDAENPERDQERSSNGVRPSSSKSNIDEPWKDSFLSEQLKARSPITSPWPFLQFSVGTSVRPCGKFLYFLRNSKKEVSTRDTDIANEIFSGVLDGDAGSIRNVISRIYLPSLSLNQDWGKNSEEEKKQFFHSVDRFIETLGEVAESSHPSVNLSSPSVEVENTPNEIAKAATDTEIVEAFEKIIKKWSTEIDRILSSDSVHSSNDVGPNSEYEFWRVRFASINRIQEILSQPSHKAVAGVIQAARSPAIENWRSVDNKITDAYYEAKDNVKYLGALLQFTEPLYSGAPPAIIDLLPALVNNLKMIHTISRYYNTTARMQGLFVKITNQMILNCTRTIKAGGRLWEQDVDQLIRNLQDCMTLNEIYQEQYRIAKRKLETQPEGYNFDFDELEIFGKLNLFCKRVEKLIDVFSTVKQFRILEQQNIDGMEPILKTFKQIILGLQKQSGNLLDYKKPSFDKDYIAFNRQTEELEQELKVFIGSYFENTTNTDKALQLLYKFQSILTRESLKTELDSKFSIIFHNYGQFLEKIQETYELQKENPPQIRNIPPVAGHVAWCRQLIRRIEEPMDKLKLLNSTVDQRESRKIFKLYNRIARTLWQYEAMWLTAWKRAIKQAKQGLSATIIVRHPRNNKIYVNFDEGIYQLINETKWLAQMGVEVPGRAKAIHMQEDKFKHYNRELSDILSDYQACKELIPQHLAKFMEGPMMEFERVLAPGLKSLTWSSLKIGNYISSVAPVLVKFKDLVTKVLDIMKNRVEANLKAIRSSILLKTTMENLHSLDQFLDIQQRYIEGKAKSLDILSCEIEMAVEDIIKSIAAFSGNTSNIQEKKTELQRLVYRDTQDAILNSVLDSLKTLRMSFASRDHTAFMEQHASFFNANVELVVPNVNMFPTFEDISSSLHDIAKFVLESTKFITSWNGLPELGIYKAVMKSPKTLGALMLFKGSLRGLKQEVEDFLKWFDRYSFLWNTGSSSKVFSEEQPSVAEFQQELQSNLKLENELISMNNYQISSLELNTEPIKDSLKKQAQEAKTKCAFKLHSLARRKLEELMDWIEQSDATLKKPIKDLEALGTVMGVLKHIRDTEISTDRSFLEIEELYNLLGKFGAEVPKAESDSVLDLRYKYDVLRRTALQTSDEVSKLQGPFRKELIESIKVFKVDVISFRNEYETHGPVKKGISPQDAMERLKKYQRLFDERYRKFKTFRSGEQLFGLEQQEYPLLTKTKKELNLLEKLYSLYMVVIKQVNSYADLLWTELNFAEITDEVNQFQTACKRLPAQLKGWEAYKELKQTIDDFLELQPLLEQLSETKLKDRHWRQIMDITGTTLNLDHDVFKLKHIMEANLLVHKDDIEEICVAAKKEAELEKKFESIVEEWKNENLVFAEFKHRGPIALKGAETADTLEHLEDSQMSLSSMMTSRYLTPLRNKVAEMLDKLSSVAETIDVWKNVQAVWMYLEAVFSSGDIAKQLPAEAKKFKQIDKNWVKIMNKAHELPNVLEFCYENELLKTLPTLQEQLEVCQKSLSGYVEQKRNMFPRFYFVSDPVLLEILSQSSDPHSIQEHLSSIFDSINTVTFDSKEKNKILAMQSHEGEHVPFFHPVIAQGNVEDWLNKLEEEMKKTLKDIIKEAAMDCKELPLTKFIEKYPAQVALLGIQFIWTLDVEYALTKARTEKRILAETNKKVSAIMKQLTAMTREELSKRDRTKIETLITIQVHQRDVFRDDIYAKKIRDPTAFEWQKQARFYWLPESDNCVIRIADQEFDYCFEYLGCKERLVITPLTDRCYITLSQALGMKLGGAPAGPAGTGKTETVKDLGRTLGKYVVVSNCSDQMDTTATGKIFKGLAQSGAWGDFDEFNRILLPVLSVVAQQISKILSAMRERRESFIFTDGQRCKLIPTTGFFITMNPTYAGRVSLPENLKVLFRGVAMMVPDRRIIIKVKLAAAGYNENEVLSKKFDILYRLCEQQLSKQPHYDFGLRNILSVLRTAGATRRSNPSDTESFLLMRTLRDMNMSKLVAEDVDLFNSLLEDLFPDLNAGKRRFPEIEAAIKEHIAQLNLEDHQAWFDKVIQLYETSLVRHGIMVVGPSGAGKTRCYEILLKALSDVERPHKEFRMNPKAITAGQMFGILDMISNDWTDGIFSALWRKANKQKNVSIWIICDGPVDTIWIENLNTVLDDNRILTLANGDRLAMAPTVKMCFEVENLNNASPATVSRAGQIYMSESVLEWRPVLKSKLREAKDNYPDLDFALTFFEPLFEDWIDKVVEYVTKSLELKMSVGKNSLVLTSFDVLLSVILSLVKRNASPSEQHLSRLFSFALCWGVGGLLEAEDRLKLNTYLRSKGLDLPQDNSETVFEHFVDAETGEWRNWNEEIPRWEYPGDDDLAFSTLFVPTQDSVRSQFLLDSLTSLDKAVMFIGSSGTAKTVTIEQFLTNSVTEQHVFKKFNFSSATSPNIFQRSLEAVLDKRVGSSIGPKGGKTMTVFIDDINMPEVNEWGDQVTNEIVRQVIEFNGFYNLLKPGDWRKLVDLTYVAAMSHPGGGKNDIPNRLKRHFCIFNITAPSRTSIDQIFGSIMRGRFSTNNGYPQSVCKVTENITEITIKFWKMIQEKMLPTPNKFHYIFNLRDLSRVFQGVIQCPREILQTGISFLALWKHECTRVFSDRLNEVSDKKWFDESINRILAKNFAEDALAVEKSSYFVNFLRDPEVDPDTGEYLEEAPKVYEPSQSLGQLKERLEMLMNQFNENTKINKLELVLFDMAIKHVVRISRVLSLPRGNALLVGVGGSGKQSLTRLASFISGYQIEQIVPTKGFSEKDFLEYLKKLYLVAGVNGKSVTFIFTDNDVKKETFLEHINNFLSSGEIPGLFPKEEIDAVINDMRPIAKREAPNTVGKNDTYDNLYKFFIDRVRDNLHLVLCFSPIGEKFRNRARKFPGLISGCTINWFFPWPEDALVAVASKFLDGFPMDCTEKVKEQLIKHMAHVHSSMLGLSDEYFQRYRRHVYSTPRSYLAFINSFKQVYTKKFNEINKLAQNVKGGLEKLHTAEEDVKKMKIQMKDKEVELVEAQQKTDKLLKEISARTTKTEKKKSEVATVKDALELDAKQVEAGRDEAQRDLAQAKPALEEAEAAIDSIKAKDIQVLKQLRTPPEIIKIVFDGVLLLMRMPLEQVKTTTLKKGTLFIQDSYSHATKLMADINFLKNLRQFDSDTINDETVELLSPYLELEEFTPENAKKSSSAAAGLATWVGAMSRYYEISKDVKPKIEKLQIAEDRLRIARNKLQDKEDELATVEAELAKVQATFDDALRKKNKMQDEADSIKRKLESANNLISALSGERDRWTEQSGHFKDLITRLVGEVALACGFISYCGPFNSEFRSLMLQRFYQDCLKRNIPVKKFDGNESFDVTKFLVDESEIGEWNIQGLPTDPHSVQNGIMVTRSDKWPLLIDPQGQGLAWIKKREENNNPMICQISDRNFKTQLTDAISLGRPMIIENVSDYLDPMLDPILEKAIFTVGKLKQIVIQGRAYDWSDDFRLYLTSKMSNPHYSPETFAKTTIIDFAVTMSGLEQQLLGVVIQQERADLEERREKLLKDVNENEKEIKGLEDDLLQQLASSEKNLLEDTKLIETLANTKAKASEVKEKLSNAKQTEKTINLAREAYNPVAIRGSVLYFVIVEMSLVNSMYQTSLKQFLRIFDTSIQKSETDPDPEKRINNIIEYLTFYVYLHVVRGLFERHKLLFLLLIATKVLLRDGHVSLAAFNALLKGGAAKDMNSITIPKWDWIPDSAWLNVIALSETVDKFKHLPDLIKKNEKLWKFFYDQEAPESAKVPDLEAELTDFDRLLLVRSLREDRSMLAATNFISKSLGPHYVKAVPLNLTETLEESTERTPVIFLLSPGSDPTTMIENLAKRKKKELHSKSMGHNQEAAAKEILVNGFNSGGWVLLQNCHLGLDFLKEVEDMLLTDEIHPEFRLWVTSEPTDKFPIGLLQMSIKLTNEPPEGLKAGLQRSFQWVNQDILDASRRVEWKPLVYSLCFAHSIVQERRKFGSLGWNIPYEFNQSDLAASFQFLQNHFMAIGDEAKKGPSVSWDTVHYMICEVQYGGRITDDFDRRLFNTYGHLWLSDNILKNNFSFAPNYNIIMGEDIATYKKEIENIPSLDKPEVFGLHPNADITYRTNQSVETLKTIMDVQPKQAAGKGGETREDTVSRMAAQWLNDLPDDFKMDEVREQIVALGGLGKPLNIFLFQEVERLQHVLEVTRTTLEDLQLAIAGTIVMSADLQNILNSLYDAAVPSMWLKVSWTSPNIGLWFSEFVQRYDQLSKWLVNNRPKTFWLTGFFNPQGFLTAVRQEVARARKWALDNVVVKTEVLTKDKDDIRDGPSEGVYIHGLFLEGAGWDVKNSRLEDSQPKVLHVPLPVLHVTGVDSTKTEKKAAKYICPVYKKPRRTDQHYIFDVELNTNEAPEKWILGGVALLCSTT